jgi:glycosyltransferase involved in cell wall biosynthesis
MKLLVFAHTPPPHHGQSYMVKLLIEGLGGDRRGRPQPGTDDSQYGIECYHVNCRYSETIEDIGSFRLGKMWLVVRYSLEAIWCRFRYGIRAFYYVPAPGKRAALYRDWVVMLLCRPFFPHIIHHWHAGGLGDWLGREGTWFERWFTHRILGRPTLGIALAIPSMRDPLWFRSQVVVNVPNGIPDPCPDFERRILPRRRARRAARLHLLAGGDCDADTCRDAGEDFNICRVLFLAHCSRNKGLFDTLEGVLTANEQLRARRAGLQFHLTVAGAFVNPESEEEFRARAARQSSAVRYAGFVRDGAKEELLAAADIFCFPTFYPAEGLPVNLIEAISFGLPVVTTRWRAIPEVLPPDYSGFVPPESPAAIAAGLIAAAAEDGTGLRQHYLAHFTLAHHLQELQANLRSVDSSGC